MSAWYLFSALGFYPVAPGSGQYSLGSPLIRSADIKLENGRTLRIEAANQSDKNIYVQSVSLNGRRLDRRYITNAEIMRGGKLQFIMGNTPPHTSQNREQ